MPRWTSDGLIEHRKRMGWPELRDDQLARIVDILNDALDSLESLDGNIVGRNRISGSRPSSMAVRRVPAMSERMLNMLGVHELCVLMRRRGVTSVDLVEACLNQIERVQAATNAFVVFDKERALEQARALDDQAMNGLFAGRLHGIPIGVKDNFWTNDFPTTACSKVHQGKPVGMDATAVARLRAAGAIIVGKTNMHEWAYGATNHVSANGPTRNPWNTDHITGGSSGGSGAALAAQMVPAALGSDTGGSVRIPAAACGVCGLKPTYGRISRYGVLPLSWSLDVAGPMARSARDLRILFEVLAGEDSKDPATLSSSCSGVPDFAPNAEVRHRCSSRRRVLVRR